MAHPRPGWYPDPSGSGQVRYWDGAQWTSRLRPKPDAGVDQPLAPEPVQERAGGRRARLVAVLGGVLVVVAVGTVGLFVLLPSDEDASEMAEDADREQGAAADDDSDGPDATAGAVEDDTDPAETEANGEPADLPVADVDPAEQRYLLVHQGSTRTVELDDGRAEVPGVGVARLVEDLVVQGDVTGDGQDELVAVFAIDASTEQGPDDVPALGILSSVPADVAPVDPPELILPFEEGVPVEVGRIDALSVTDGAVEARVIGLPYGSNELVLSDDVVYPLAENPHYELRFAYDDGRWVSSFDGPVTRSAEQVAIDGGVSADVLTCTGSAETRGSHPRCIFPIDGSPEPGLISMLIVDDDRGYRAVIATELVRTHAEDVFRELGTGDHFCADIAEAAEGDTFDWELPMAAISYWFHVGMPQRMDASSNGIPCQTVFDGVAAFLDSTDGRVDDHYDRHLDRRP